MVSCRTLLESAASSPYGVVIRSEQRGLRRSLYYEREKARREGNLAFDSLSFIAKPGGELWIVRRNQIPQPSTNQVVVSRALEITELPQRIGARGRCRLSLHRIT